MYNTAPTYTTPIHPFSYHAWSLSGSWNLLWEPRKFGTIFIQASLGISRNNSINSNKLSGSDFATYKQNGGADTSSSKAAALGSNKIYITNYENFTTWVSKLQIVYFIKTLPFGVSGQIERQFDKNDLWNLALGIPFRLKDNDGKPTVNFKLQYKVDDLSGKLLTDKSWGEKSSLGISIGLPFSSVIY